MKILLTNVRTNNYLFKVLIYCWIVGFKIEKCGLNNTNTWMIFKFTLLDNHCYQVITPNDVTQLL